MNSLLQAATHLLARCIVKVGAAMLGCALGWGAPVAAQQTTGASGYGSVQVVRGAANTLSVGRDGSVWAIDPAGLLFVRAPSASSWSGRGDNAMRVAAIDQHSAWLLSWAGDLSLFATGNRRAIAAPTARDVAVGIDGTLALVTVTGALLAGRDGQWIDANFPHGLAQSVVLDEHVLPWVINDQAALYRFDGTQWQAVVSGARNLSIGSAGSVVLTELTGRTSVWDVTTQRWSAVAALAQVPLMSTAIAPNGDLWSVGGSGEIILLQASGTARITVLRAPATFTRLLQWRTMRGRAAALSVSPAGQVFAVDTEGNAHRYQGRGVWSLIPGQYTAMAGALDQSLWALRAGGQLMRRVRGVWSDVPAMPLTAIAPASVGGGLWALSADGGVMRFMQPEWRPIRITAPLARQISVDEANQLWLLDFNGDLWKSASSNSNGALDLNWSRVSFGGLKAKSVAGGARQSAYVVASNNDIYWFDPREALFKPANGRAIAVALGPLDALWAVSADGNILASQGALAAEVGATEPTTGAAAVTPELSRPAVVNFVGRADTTRKTLQFRAVEGSAGEVGVSSGGAVFATGIESGVACFSTNLQKFLPVVSGAARRLSVSPDRDAWVVDVYARVALIKAATGVATSATSITATDVSVAADGTVYLVGTDERVFRRSTADGTFEPLELRANGFALGGYRIAAVSRNVFWLANKSAGLWRCNGGECSAQNVTAKDVGVGPEGSVFVVDASGNLLRQVTGMTAGTASANAVVGSFARVGQGGVANVSVGPQGLPWIVTTAGKALTAEPLPQATLSNRSINDFCQSLSAVTANGASAGIGASTLPQSPPIITIIARPDSVTLGRGGSVDLLANDSLGSARADASGNVRFQVQNSELPAAAIGATGLVTIPGTQLPGTFAVRYSICATPLGQPCASTTANIRVTPPSFVATAVDDTFTLSRGGSFNLLANDRVDGGAAAIGTNAAFSVVSSTLPTAAVRDGVVNIALDQAPGTYVVAYQLCGLIAGQSCVSATARIVVSPPSFAVTVVDDNASLQRGASFDLLANDRINGAAVVIGSNARFVLVSSTLPASSVVSGRVTIAADQALGTYAIRYQLCGLIVGQPCAEASASIAVVAQPFVAVLTPESVTLWAGQSVNLLGNDTVNGGPVQLGSNARLNIVSSTLPVSAAGTVTIAESQSLGVYSVNYQLCGLVAGQGCVGTTSTITVIVRPFVAVVNPESVTLSAGQSVSLLSNDTVNGGPVQLGSNARLNVTSSTLPVSAAGTVSIAESQPLGVYSVNYQLCGLITGQICVGTTATITVIAQPFVAVVNPESVTLWAGQSVNLLSNDTVNGGPVQLGSNARLNVTSSTLPVSAAGSISIGESQALGMYSVSYQLCGLIAGQGCVGTTSTITVIAQPFVAVVNPESVTLWAGQSVNLLSNDTVNGGPVQLGSNARLNIVSSTLPVSAAGTVTIADSQPLGMYSVSYQLCGLIAGQGCVGTISTITVIAQPLVAVVNPESVTLWAGQSVNLLSNDTVNGGPVQLGSNARLNIVSSTLPVSAAGTVTIGDSQPLGVYSVNYQLCGLNTGQGCVGTTAIVTVVALPFTAFVNPENVTLRAGESVNLVANDSVRGEPVVLGFNARFEVVESTLPASAAVSNGVVSISSAVPVGTYSISYRLCGPLAGQNCIGTTSLITVVLPPPPFLVVVNPDNVTLQPGQSINLLANDRVDGRAVSLGQNAGFEAVSSTLPAGAVSASGVVTVPLGTAAGVYTVRYRLCGLLSTQGCLGTTSTITVVLSVPPFVAVVNPDNVSLQVNQTVNLLSNDTVNGGAVVLGNNASFSVISTTLPASSISAVGLVTVPAAQPLGIFTVNYRLCGLLAGQACVQTTSTITVIAAPLFAVADAATLSPGGTLNLLANDSLNGATPLAAQLNVTFNTASAFLTQTGGLLTLAAGAPTGSTQTATYGICQTPANAPCSGPVNVTITVPSVITAVADTATLTPGGTLNLLANDSLNGATPLSPQVAVTFNTASAFLTQVGGVLTLAAGASPGSTQTASYSICRSPANTPCSATVNVTITVPGTISAVADTATLSPGGTLNLLANDSLNGAVPVSAQVTVTFASPSENITQIGGLLTLSAAAQPGSTHAGTYSICQAPANTLCSGPVNVTITVPSTITAVTDSAILPPGGTLNLLANDSLNGVAPLPAQVAVTFNTASPFLTQSNGVVTLDANAQPGSIHNATYSICRAPANTPCSGPVNVTITTTSVITAAADAATLAPGGTLNLLTNDSLNGPAPLPAQVTITFNTASAFLSQTGGLLTLAAAAPAGSTQTATYSICKTPTNAPCSATVAVTITVPNAISAVADVATLIPGGTLNLLANDFLNGAAPLAAQVAVTFNTAFPTLLSQTGGVLTLSPTALGGNVLAATYSICQLPANTPCSGPVNVTITVQSTISAVADTATRSPGGTVNLLANDLLNGDSPMPSQVTVTFSTASAFLSQANGIVTLAVGAPGGAVQTGTYSICLAPANTPCSATVAVTITAPVTAIANPDGPTVLVRDTLAGVGVHLNDTLNGALVLAGALNVQYTLNNNAATFKLSVNGYLELVDDLFATPGVYVVSYTFCEAGVATNCSTTTATINVQAP